MSLNGVANATVSWNFNKFLIGRDGQVVARFGSQTTPEDAELLAAVDQALAAGDKPVAAPAPYPHGSRHGCYDPRRHRLGS